jgi:hypothetical protein
LGSLSELAKARGEYAHGKADYTITPEKSKNIVQDCLRLCENVKFQAITNVFEKEYKTFSIQRIASCLKQHLNRST